ncbi:MAG: response regulator [Halothiobacillaceae bacterium]
MRHVNEGGDKRDQPLAAEGGEPAAPALILCADDQEELRRDIAEELKEAGYRALEAVDGQEVIEQLAAARPDLILCDINMPRLNGYQVLARLREQYPDLADTPFVFLTALSDAREVVDGKRLGADDYLVKPVDFDLLLATIDSRLRQVRRMRRKADGELSELRRHQRRVEQILGSATRALDLLSVGVILLDACEQVLFANTKARQLSEAGDGIRLVADRLQAMLQTEQAMLRDVFKRLRRQQAEDEHRVECLRLSRDAGQRELLLLACALDACQLDATAPCRAVLISDPEQRLQVPDSLLARLFGLTPTEARIAAALAQGLRSEEIAREMGVSTTTVAFHLRNLFQKTDTNRQADLIAVLLSAALSLAPP